MFVYSSQQSAKIVSTKSSKKAIHENCAVILKYMDEIKHLSHILNYWRAGASQPSGAYGAIFPL